LLEDHRDVDDEVLVDVYEEIAPCKYKKATTKVSIAEYCIVSDIAIVKSNAKKGKGANSDVAITQQNFNKVSLLMENAGNDIFKFTSLFSVY
jgi:hypothetical protein